MTVPAEIAYSCLKFVPIDDNLALAQVELIGHFVQFQSTLAYLKSPPAGYLEPAVDVLGELDDVAEKALSNQYTNEYDFENDLFQLAISAHDGHFSILPFLTGLFIWSRPISLISILENATDLPQIFVYCVSGLP